MPAGEAHASPSFCHRRSPGTSSSRLWAQQHATRSREGHRWTCGLRPLPGTPGPRGRPPRRDCLAAFSTPDAGAEGGRKGLLCKLPLVPRWFVACEWIPVTSGSRDGHFGTGQPADCRHRHVPCRPVQLSPSATGPTSSHRYEDGTARFGVDTCGWLPPRASRPGSPTVGSSETTPVTSGPMLFRHQDGPRAAMPADCDVTS